MSRQLTRIISICLFWVISSCNVKEGALYNHSVIQKQTSTLYEEYVVDQSTTAEDTLCSIKIDTNDQNSRFFVSDKLSLGVEVRKYRQGEGYTYNIAYEDINKAKIKNQFETTGMAGHLRISNYDGSSSGKRIDVSCQLAPDKNGLLMILNELSSEERMKFVIGMLKEKYHFSKIVFTSILTDSKNTYISVCKF